MPPKLSGFRAKACQCGPCTRAVAVVAGVVVVDVEDDGNVDDEVDDGLAELGVNDEIDADQLMLMIVKFSLTTTSVLMKLMMLMVTMKLALVTMLMLMMLR